MWATRKDRTEENMYVDGDELSKCSFIRLLLVKNKCLWLYVCEAIAVPVLLPTSEININIYDSSYKNLSGRIER